MKNVVFILMALFAGSLRANDTDLFIKANSLYKQQQYDEALSIYQKLQQSHPKSATLCYNIGNTYYKKRQISKAIVFYERAKRLRPTDEDIAHNLLFAKMHTLDKIDEQKPPLPLWIFQQATGCLTSFQWTVSAVVFCWLTFASLLVFLFAKNYRRIGFYFAIILGSLSIIFLLIGKKTFSIENKCDNGIVAFDKIFVKSAPDQNAADLFVLHEGAEVSLLDQVDGFAKIRLQDGKVGWVLQQDIIAI